MTKKGKHNRGETESILKTHFGEKATVPECYQDSDISLQTLRVKNISADSYSDSHDFLSLEKRQIGRGREGEKDSCKGHEKMQGH